MTCKPRGVVIVSPGGLQSGGGMGTVTRLMVEWYKLNREEMPVLVLDPRGGSSVAWSLLRLPYTFILLVATRITGKYDVLHLQVSERSSFVRKGAILALGRLLGMKVVVHHHGAELIPFYRSTTQMMRGIVHWTTSRCDVNIVLGKHWQVFLKEEVAIDEDRILIKANAVPDIKEKNELIGQDPWHFLIAANLSDRKGIGDLLVAIEILQRKSLPVRLTVAGGGEVDRFKRMAKSLGIADRCNFTGWIDPKDLKNLLKSDVNLVLPSYNEGLPMTILEALSAGVPIITTPVGSIPEHLINGVHCIYVVPGEPEKIASAIQKLAENPALRTSLKLNGRKLYNERFEFDSYMKWMMDLYERLLNNGKR